MTAPGRRARDIGSLVSQSPCHSHPTAGGAGAARIENGVRSRSRRHGAGAPDQRRSAVGKRLDRAERNAAGRNGGRRRRWEGESRRTGQAGARAATGRAPSCSASATGPDRVGANICARGERTNDVETCHTSRRHQREPLKRLSRNPHTIARGHSIDELAFPAVPAALPSSLLEQRPNIR